ncbi:MAG: flagellar hook-associated protein FlgK [Deltaproteobacteria bacterium]|nr:flagellar hook-associated protein FlgK [Deltaproteobacteria bacterium]
MGKRALLGQQSGMSVSGHNIANINNENYSRQRVELEEQHPRRDKFGMGADVRGVARVADQFTSQRLIGEQSKGGTLDIRENVLGKLEHVFNEMEGNGIRHAMNEFWDAWAHLATNPEGEMYRVELITRAESLANRLQETRSNTQLIRKELNARISERVEMVNQMATQLARQNEAIQQTDRGQGEANDLKDEREKTLKELSKLVQIDTVEQDGALNVSLGGGWPLVVGRHPNRVEASLQNEELGMFRLRGVDPAGISRDLTDILRQGELGEMFRLRDGILPGYQGKLDELAGELSYKINRLHNTGTGINSAHEKLNSSFALKADAQVKPLPFLKDGKFVVQMVNADRTLDKAYAIQITAGQDTLKDIVARINQTAGEGGDFQARLNREGSVNLEAGNGKTFFISQDESEFSVVMGFNNFFETLKGAEDIHLNPRLKAEPNKISTGKDMVPGDNTTALAINSLQFSPTMQDDSVTYDEYYNGLLAQLGLEVNRSQAERSNQKLVMDQFQKMRDETSSVNMDEEVADMVQYQRGFEAASKFISTVDEMTQTVIRM